ncbi:unnamed protein product [Leuciscus chuanchicus]
MRRYRDAGVEPPQLLYVDRDCCSSHGGSKTADMFRKWDKLVVRLDICHLMGRFASGVTTRATSCISPSCSSCLRASSCGTQRTQPGCSTRRKGCLRRFSSDAGVWRHVSRRDMAFHCRCRTHGAAETERLIGESANPWHFQAFGSSRGGGGIPPLVEDDELADGQQEVEDLTLHVPGEYPGQPANTPEPSRPTSPPEPAPHSPVRSSPEPQQAAEDYREPDDQPEFGGVASRPGLELILRVDELIRLYEALSPYDRARVVYPPRYRDRPARGRFMAVKPSRTTIPGVESLRR